MVKRYTRQGLEDAQHGHNLRLSRRRAACQSLHQIDATDLPRSYLGSSCQPGANADIEPVIQRVSLSIDHRPLRLYLWNGQPTRLSRSGVMRSSTMSQRRVADELASRGSATLRWMTLRVLFHCLRAFRRQCRVASGANGGSREREHGKPICFRRPRGN